jgi:hypothetical protein
MVAHFPLIPSSGSRIATVDARQLPITVELLPLEESNQGEPASGIIRGYLASRMQGVEVELVDSWFPWGRYTINLLVRLRKVSDNEFRTLGAVLLDVW